MAEHALGVEIVTPESALYAGAATALVAATSEGDLTIMVDHAEMIGDIVPGLIKIEELDGTTTSIVVHGGFLQVRTADGAAVGLVEGVGESDRSTRATILAGIAEMSDEIDISRAEDAKVQAEARLAELKAQLAGTQGDEEALRDAHLELAEAEAAYARAEIRLATSKPLGMG